MFSLSERQLGTLYQTGEIKIKEGLVKLVHEVEGKLQKSSDTTYNHEYERESDLTVTLDGVRYEGTVFEGGDSEDDMQIVSSTVFN